MSDGEKNYQFNRFGVLGGGAWGTSLAMVAAFSENNPDARPVKIWAHEAETVENINQAHQNKVFLPDIDLPASISATHDLHDIAACDAVFMVVPAQFARSVIKELAPLLSSSVPLILCSKGIEPQSLNLMSELAKDFVSPAQLAVLSGPSFAADVARARPTAVTLAGTSTSMLETLAQKLICPHFRIYLSDDIIGAEIGGAVKNVLAIACGIIHGKQFGASARAAIMTRGFGEMMQLGIAMGARPETMTGLSGLGDLILTASSMLSRNFSFGVALGEGKTPAEILGTRSSVSEGAASAASLRQLAVRHKIEMPICRAVAQIVAGEIDIDGVIAALLARPLGVETPLKLESQK